MGLVKHLAKHTVKKLKKEISSMNIKGYSKLRKADVIKLIIKNKSRFPHLISDYKETKYEVKLPTDYSDKAFKEFLNKEVYNKSKRGTKKLPSKIDKTKVKKKWVSAKQKMKKKARRYRFNVNGKEFDQTNGKGTRIEEGPDGKPRKVNPSLWSVEANRIWSKLAASGQLSFSYKFKI